MLKEQDPKDMPLEDFKKELITLISNRYAKKEGLASEISFVTANKRVSNPLALIKDSLISDGYTIKMSEELELCGNKQMISYFALAFFNFLKETHQHETKSVCSDQDVLDLMNANLTTQPGDLEPNFLKININDLSPDAKDVFEKGEGVRKVQNRIEELMAETFDLKEKFMRGELGITEEEFTDKLMKVKTEFEELRDIVRDADGIEGENPVTQLERKALATEALNSKLDSIGKLVGAKEKEEVDLTVDKLKTILEKYGNEALKEELERIPSDKRAVLLKQLIG